MIRQIAWMAAALALIGSPALAQTSCGGPPAAPAIPDGAKASAGEITDAYKQVTAFMKSSDDWQLCVKNDLDKQKSAAAAAKQPFDAKIEKAADAQGDANQKDKERVGKEMNAALAAYHKAHPK
jgi:hypothetical protein